MCCEGTPRKGEGRKTYRMQADTHTHTHTFTKLTTGCRRAGRWLWFLKPRAVLETEAAHSSIRHRSSALDLLFTKKNPPLLKCPFYSSLPFQGIKQLGGGGHGGGTQDTTTCVHPDVAFESKFYLDGEKSRMNQNTGCRLNDK